jgi:guanosine-3',5'-bis(diphosphate) 3'-pyrophosphohydrolase
MNKKRIEMTKVEIAFMVAEKAHAGQSYDIYPYMYHVRQVVKIAQDLGYDETIVIACILHDVLEDTELSYNDIKKAFGVEVAEIVYAVTDELGRNRKERKSKTYPKIQKIWKAAVVKICDRIANVTQSMKYNKGLYETYRKEHSDFCSGIHNADHPKNEMDKAWNKLNELILDVKFEV